MHRKLSRFFSSTSSNESRRRASCGSDRCIETIGRHATSVCPLPGMPCGYYLDMKRVCSCLHNTDWSDLFGDLTTGFKILDNLYTPLLSRFHTKTSCLPFPKSSLLGNQLLHCIFYTFSECLLIRRACLVAIAISVAVALGPSRMAWPRKNSRNRCEG